MKLFYYDFIKKNTFNQYLYFMLKKIKESILVEILLLTIIVEFLFLVNFISLA